ncbi:hypothetical protein ABZX40_18695 [Streptomyces sp. NPDC004610]|uniref:hypothetical protein n=1 Tax=unclassified Streptomyces TaxID=2593676 RepID=UPI0033AABF15
MTDSALQLLRQHPRLAGLAAFPFAFDLDRAAQDPGGPVRLASGAPLEAIAGDDSGGTYFRCADGSVLYASADGTAGVIGSSVSEALEVVVGLPGWAAYGDPGPGADAAEVLDARAPTGTGSRAHEALDETRSEHALDAARSEHALDAARSELRAGLGMPARSPAELLALLHTALGRTEPDFLLLDDADGHAYAPLHGRARPPLWEPVLARGRADLALLRAGDGETAAAMRQDAVRRRVVLRAAQFDRGEEDLGLLRRLLRLAAGASTTDELRLAAVLVGRFGRAADLPLLNEVRETDFDTACGLSELPGLDASGTELARWAQWLDESMFGTDPAGEPLLTWTGLALDQGLTEHARVALIHELDALTLDQGRLRRPDDPSRLNPEPLGALAREFERLGDLRQALRAQRLYAALQETAWDRVSARLTQARLEREAGRAVQAAGTLTAVRAVLADPGDGSLAYWRRVNLGRFIAEEHYALANALADARLPRQARAVLAAGDAILGELSDTAAKGVRQLAEETATWVWGVS